MSVKHENVQSYKPYKLMIVEIHCFEGDEEKTRNQREIGDKLVSYRR